MLQHIRASLQLQSSFVDLELKFGMNLFVCIGLSAASAPSAGLTVPYVYTEAPRYDAVASQTGAERFSRGAALQIVRPGRKDSLFPSFAASADAAISFDGRRILFAGKQRSSDPWQVWEGPLVGSPSRITEAGEAITPFYLPGGKIVYAKRSSGGFQIEVIALDTRIARRLTYAPGNYLVCDVLRDGRILFEGPHPSGSVNKRDLYTVYSDGSGVETYRCDHRHGRAAGRELSSGDIVFESGGKLARFTSARAVEQAVPQVDGQFAGPVAEIAPGDWLVSYRLDATSPFALYRWTQPSGSLVKLQSAPSAELLQPVLVRARKIPKRHPSALGDREGANLLCLNVYTAHEAIRAGSIAFVRVWTQDDAGSTLALGQAPVAADGSFFVQVPEDRPIRFELLDRTGKTAASEHGWFWTRRGEQRICVGCHAGPGRAPENVVPDVLMHNPEPVKMMMPARGGGVN
jgi:Hydrazine synthase alpha subunit middle domain